MLAENYDNKDDRAGYLSTPQILVGASFLAEDEDCFPHFKWEN